VVFAASAVAESSNDRTNESNGFDFIFEPFCVTIQDVSMKMQAVWGGVEISSYSRGQFQTS